MGMTDDYSVEEFTADIPVEDYVARYLISSVRFAGSVRLME